MEFFESYSFFLFFFSLLDNRQFISMGDFQ